jgi:curved DNA-binding protein CbpA
MPPESQPAAAGDHYALLGVDRLADPETLHRAYRLQAKRVHPDALPFDSAARATAEEQFKALTLAYETLADRARRAAYDATLPPPAPPPEPEAPPAPPQRPGPRQWVAPADPVMRPAKKPPKPAAPPAFMDFLREATRRREEALED